MTRYCVCQVAGMCVRIRDRINSRDLISFHLVVLMLGAGEGTSSSQLHLSVRCRLITCLPPKLINVKSQSGLGQPRTQVKDFVFNLLEKGKSLKCLNFPITLLVSM